MAVCFWNSPPATLGGVAIKDLYSDADLANTNMPRARGSCLLRAKQRGQASAIADLRMSGCMKMLFARSTDRVDAITINSAGGLTSGDRLDMEIKLEPASSASVTTQAAERAYRAQAGKAVVETELSVGLNAKLFWLPQELILFDGAALHRKLYCDLDENAQLLLVEPVVFGRALMGERLRHAYFKDQISIDRCGAPLYRDTTHLNGDVEALLGSRGIAYGARAMASLVYVGPDAEARLQRIARHKWLGVSLIQPDVMVLRLLASDSFEMRRTLLPILDDLTDNTLPTSWRL